MKRYWGGIRVKDCLPACNYKNPKFPDYIINGDIISRDDCTEFTDEDITRLRIIDSDITVIEKVQMVRS